MIRLMNKNLIEFYAQNIFLSGPILHERVCHHCPTNYTNCIIGPVKQKKFA